MPFEGDNMMGVKRTNRSAALHILHECGSMSRKRLSESIKLTPAAITKIVGEMIAEGLLTEGSMLPGSGVGRREVMVELNVRARAARRRETRGDERTCEPRRHRSREEPPEDERVAG